MGKRREEAPPLLLLANPGAGFGIVTIVLRAAALLAAASTVGTDRLSAGV
jgi:hypothetical protein